MNISSLIDGNVFSPYFSRRDAIIDTITIHIMAAPLSAEECGRLFQKPGKNASSNYGIGVNGEIYCYVPEEYRAWTSSNRANDMRAITIECASDSVDPYAINDNVMHSLGNLLCDIVRRYDTIPELRWTGCKEDIGNTDVQNMTVHRWFANKACPGEYLMERMGLIAANVNARLAAEKEKKEYGLYVSPLNLTQLEECKSWLNKTYGLEGIKVDL